MVQDGEKRVATDKTHHGLGQKEVNPIDFHVQPTNHRPLNHNSKQEPIEKVLVTSTVEVCSNDNARSGHWFIDGVVSKPDDVAVRSLALKALDVVVSLSQLRLL